MAFIRTRIWAVEKRTVMKKALIFWSWVITTICPKPVIIPDRSPSGLGEMYLRGWWSRITIEDHDSITGIIPFLCLSSIVPPCKTEDDTFACMISRGTLIPINATLRTNPCWELCNLLVIKKVSSGLLYFKTTLLWASQSDATLPLSLTKLESALIVIIFGVQFLHWESYQMASRYQKDIDAVYILNMIWRIRGRMKPFILELNLKSLA